MSSGRLGMRRRGGRFDAIEKLPDRCAIRLAGHVLNVVVPSPWQDDERLRDRIGRYGWSRIEQALPGLERHDRIDVPVHDEYRTSHLGDALDRGKPVEQEQLHGQPWIVVG